MKEKKKYVTIIIEGMKRKGFGDTVAKDIEESMKPKEKYYDHALLSALNTPVTVKEEFYFDSIAVKISPHKRKVSFALSINYNIIFKFDCRKFKADKLSPKNIPIPRVVNKGDVIIVNSNDESLKNIVWLCGYIKVAE